MSTTPTATTLAAKAADNLACVIRRCKDGSQMPLSEEEIVAYFLDFAHQLQQAQPDATPESLRDTTQVNPNPMTNAPRSTTGAGLSASCLSESGSTALPTAATEAPGAGKEDEWAKIDAMVGRAMKGQHATPPAALPEVREAIEKLADDLQGSGQTRERKGWMVKTMLERLAPYLATSAREDGELWEWAATHPEETFSAWCSFWAQAGRGIREERFNWKEIVEMGRDAARAKEPQS